MLKQQYLSDPDVAGFLQYLTDVVTATTPLNHRYTVVWPRWRKWCLANRPRNSRYHFRLLVDVFNDYWWPAKNVHGVTQYDYAGNAAVLGSLKSNLCTAVATTSPNLFACCGGILNWGGVRRARPWCDRQNRQGRLLKVIVDATQILDGNDDAHVSRFNGADLHINAGLTKIYSLNSQQSIIYDGRVGAAFGLLVRMFLQSQGHPGPVPSLLAFRWGRGAGCARRDPSVHQYQFGKLDAARPWDWALCNLRANWLLQEVVAHPSVQNVLTTQWGLSSTTPPAVPLRAIEAALFMVGYRI